MAAWHLAQINIGRLRAPIDAPEIADFANNLDPINALAEASPGFVWRLQDESGNATGIRFDPDPLLALNMSVWESIESLEAFVRKTAHADFFKRRREWFERMGEAYMTLWWIEAGHLPSIEEGVERLDHLRTHGPTAHAFTFGQSFSPPS